MEFVKNIVQIKKIQMIQNLMTVMLLDTMIKINFQIYHIFKMNIYPKKLSNLNQY